MSGTPRAHGRTKLATPTTVLFHTKGPPESPSHAPTFSFANAQMWFGSAFAPNVVLRQLPSVTIFVLMTLSSSDGPVSLVLVFPQPAKTLNEMKTRI